MGKYCDESEQNQNLSPILTEDFWINVLNTINEPEFLSSCLFASPYLRKLLLSKRTSFLFAQVLRVLDKQEKFTNSDTKTLLNYRLVCKNWNTAVQQFLEMRPYHNLLLDVKTNRRIFQGCSRPIADHAFYKDPSFPTWFSIYDFEIEKLENEILPELCSFRYLNKCPTPSRHIDIMETWQISTSSDMALVHRYRIATTRILEAVGHEFWHARIYINSKLTSLYWHSLIQQYLALMPNLRTLQIMPPQAGFLGTRRNIIDVVNTAVENLTFPHLKNLKFISLERFPSEALNAILIANPNVETIEIRDSCFVSTWLQIPKNINPRRFSISVKTLQELLEIPDYWPLETLRLDVDEMYGESISLKHVFRKVEAFKNTLSECQLFLPLYPWEYAENENLEASKSKINLSKLKRLEIRVHDQYCLNFLTGLVSLEYLKISNKWQRAGFLDLDCDNLNRMERSNIWRLLPNLKQLDVEVTTSKAIQRFNRSVI